ncbi:MAG: hypothetical protein GEU95_01220 [Rhizobiales bacterium]|nr:hypothetical protein [Hyphomicrobiales bacterium]
MRRRRYWQRAKPKLIRRERPVMIECHGAPNIDPVVVTLGSESYRFHSGPRGKKVAPVYVEDHIACFLARPEMYRATH